MKDKRKVTLYLPPEIHHQLKVKAALDEESMSDVVQRVVSLYLKYPEKVEEIEEERHGQRYQVHICPKCSASLTMKDGELNTVENPTLIEEDLELEVSRASKTLGEGNLVPC